MEWLSPKVFVPLLIALVAAAVLFLVTGDDSYLVAILVSIVAAAGGIIVRPAPGVTQAEVNRLSARLRE